MDEVLRALIVSVGIVCLVAAYRRTREFLNPVTIIFVLFFVPMFLATLRLSGLQSNTWHYDTYLALIGAIGAWLILPTLLIVVAGQRQVIGLSALDRTMLSMTIYKYLTRSFAIVVIGSYLVSNYIQSGHVITVLDPEAAFRLHASFPGGIRLLARAGPAAIVLLYLGFWASRRRIDLLLLVLVFLVPLSRLSRIDMAMGMVAVGILAAALPIIRVNWWRLLLIILFLLATIFFVTDLGSLRHNRFGLYQFRYSDMIGWKFDYAGPGDVLAILYGYFPLSFENFDKTVRQFRGSYGIALVSFDWLFTGFLKLNWFTPYASLQAELTGFVPVSGAATVPTALSAFYSDFGPVAIVLPLSIYVGFWIWLYYNAARSALALGVYAIYSAGFALSSFQALIAAPLLFQQMAMVAIVILVSRRGVNLNRLDGNGGGEKRLRWNCGS